MRCPYCDSLESKVIDSRYAQKNNAIRRRRECLDCGHRFTTYETIVEFPLIMTKSDGRREEYDRAKLKKSISIACNKRPVSIETIDNIITDIEKDIEDLGQSEIPSSVIGDLVLKHLKELDEVAYIRFASVYRNFKNLSEFKEQIEKFSR